MSIEQEEMIEQELNSLVQGINTDKISVFKDITNYSGQNFGKYLNQYLEITGE
jgi:hypothetical protein